MTGKKPSDCGRTSNFILNASAIADTYNGVSFGSKHELDIAEIAKGLIDTCVKVQAADDLSDLTNMLTCQAHTLQNIFTRMSAIAMKNTELEKLKGIFSIALKAQNQCRTTILAVAEIKNPKRTTFIKQQNNQSLGHMQVINKQP